MALQRSHLVLVPTQTSLPDTRDAMKTVSQINDAQELARTPIARAIIWTRVTNQFESRENRHIRISMEGKGVDILHTALMERNAYRSIHITGKVPRQTAPKSPSCREYCPDHKGSAGATHAARGGCVMAVKPEALPSVDNDLTIPMEPPPRPNLAALRSSPHVPDETVRANSRAMARSGAPRAVSRPRRPPRLLRACELTCLTISPANCE